MAFVSFLKRIFHRQMKAVPATKQTGFDGEALAAQYLTRQGLRIKERNWRCRLGELDLICRDGEEYVFVEVKASRRRSSWLPEDRVNFRKQQKIKSLARRYLKIHTIDAPYRFDIVAVWWRRGRAANPPS